MTGDHTADLLQTQLLQMTATKDGAYLERNRCVALIARMALAMGLRAGTARTAIEGWDEAWHGVVYIDLPTGQASWHYHDSQAHLFANLPAYTGTWDGHDTPEKYRRVDGAFTPPAPATQPQDWQIEVAMQLAGLPKAMLLRDGTMQYLVPGVIRTVRHLQIMANHGAAPAAQPSAGVDSLLKGLATEELRALLGTTPQEPQR